MITVQLIVIGKLKEAYLRDACGEYAKRLGGFVRLSIVELPEVRLPDSPSPAQIEAALAQEGKAILSKLPSGCKVIPLCIEGKLLSSPELSQTISKMAVEGASQIAFVIGGSYGLSPEVKARGDLRLSMSPMTFPHQLARVMLLEQIYRAFQILSNGKYHK